ncbi:MAG: hypothetical protein PHD97_12150, partial [Bacteroidales bacterium]|nr:hypothetical protein [Bacteroidales bacterium]
MDNNIHKYKIGYIDEESQWIDKFVLRLKEAFDVFIFKLTPETSLADIMKQIDQAELDCLIV